MKNIFYLLMISVLFIACEGEERMITTVIDDPIINPPTELVTGSVNGTVTDSDGNAVADAAVTYRSSSTRTDENGRFSFSDTELFADGTFVTVAKSGYFQGSRKFYAEENIKSNIHIQLIERTMTESFTASAGAAVDVESATVDLPGGTYLTANGQAYNGEVNVFATYLDPSQEETFDQMPGDLSGVTTDNEVRGLITFGMVAVELEDAAGNPLQLPTGQKATLNMPVPSELQTAAPSTIPLWYFDEANGTWVEEGEAQLVNGEYIGEVEHFTYWNCDVPFDFIELSGILEVNNTGVNNLRIKITDTTSGLCGVAYTGARGSFSLLVPKDQELTLSVVGDCGNLAENIPLGSFGADQNLGVLSTSVDLAEFLLIGEIKDCNGEVSDYSVLEVTNDAGFTSSYNVEDDGSFYIDFSNCGAASSEITVTAVDFVGQTASEPHIVEVGGEVDLGTLSTCEPHSPGSGFTINYEGQSWALQTPMDSTVLANYTEQIIDLGNGLQKHIYEVTVLDWITAGIGEGTFIFTDGDATASYSFSTPEGFDFSGTCAYSLDPSVYFSGVSTDITVTDATIYPGDVEQVYFSFKF